MQVMDLIFFLSPSDYFFTQLILDFRVPVKFTLLRSDATHLPLIVFIFPYLLDVKITLT